MKTSRKHLLLVIVLLALTANAHPVPEIVEGQPDGMLELIGYQVEFYKTQDPAVNKNIDLVITVKDPSGQTVEGLDVQGQIIDENGAEIFYTVAEDIHGAYVARWKPSFAGQYAVQFIFRVPFDNEIGEEILKPTFAFQVIDERARNSYFAGIIAAILFSIAGIYFAFRKKHFEAKPLAYGIGLGLLFFLLGYSVSAFYEAGGERGFVVCGEKGCDIAIHWHSQLHMDICGKPYHLPLETGDLNSVHTHKELDYLHFHSLVKSDETGKTLLEPEKLRIGIMFDFLGHRFTDECFGDYCNGDTCPGSDKPGKLTMTVNDVPNDQFDDYSYKDGDEIKISFE